MWVDTTKGSNKLFCITKAFGRNIRHNTSARQPRWTQKCHKLSLRGIYFGLLCACRSGDKLDSLQIIGIDWVGPDLKESRAEFVVNIQVGF